MAPAVIKPWGRMNRQIISPVGLPWIPPGDASVCAGKCHVGKYGAFP